MKLFWWWRQKKKTETNNLTLLSPPPQEALIEILSWLPVKTLLRLKCVSKSWHALICSPHFINLHLSHSTQRDNPSLLFNSNLGLFSLPHPIDLNSPLKFQLPFEQLQIVGSCNGVLCLCIDCNTIFFFNPSTRWFAQLIEPRTDFPHDNYSRFPVLGFGYSSLTQQYKVLRILYSGLQQAEVSIYRIGTCSWWRILDVHEKYLQFNLWRGPLVNEWLHWTTRGFKNGILLTKRIVAFGFENEEFGYVPMPEFSDECSNGDMLGVLRGCLCFLRDVRNSFEVWVMSDYGVKESWSRQFSVARPESVMSFQDIMPFRILKSGEIVLRRSNGKVAVYNPRNKSNRDITLCGGASWNVAVDYVESLVSIRSKSYNAHNCCHLYTYAAVIIIIPFSDYPSSLILFSDFENVIPRSNLNYLDLKETTCSEEDWLQCLVDQIYDSQKHMHL